MSADAPPCAHLPWDSEFFGRRIARVEPGVASPERVERILAWAEAEGVECLYWLLAADDAEGIRRVEDGGFRLADTRVTLARRLEAEAPGWAPAGVEPARPGDLPGLRAIARVSHAASRFYRDPHFPRERCDALYERWIEHSCQGWAQQVLVARKGDKPLGYLSCHLEGDARGRIGLFAVAPEARGRGHDRGLLAGALHWFDRAGVREVRVSTQACNTAGLRSYERAGFLTATVEHWYHRWRLG